MEQNKCVVDTETQLSEIIALEINFFPGLREGRIIENRTRNALRVSICEYNLQVLSTL